MNKYFVFILLFCITPICTLPKEKLIEREKAEIDTFSNIWQEGFFIGNPLEKNIPLKDKAQFHVHYVTYNGERMSCLHAVYLACIQPYANTETHVLEIGPGRGAWGKKHYRC